jgi:hypothetical protein
MAYQGMNGYTSTTPTGYSPVNNTFQPHHNTSPQYPPQYPPQYHPQCPPNSPSHRSLNNNLSPIYTNLNNDEIKEEEPFIDNTNMELDIESLNEFDKNMADGNRTIKIFFLMLAVFAVCGCGFLVVYLTKM